MDMRDACKILELSGVATAEDVKKAYRRACMKYHPDRNPSGEHMMKLVNAAYAVLKDHPEEILTEDEIDPYAAMLNDALNAIMGCSLEIEICGAWIWLSGDTRLHKELLKQNGFRWAPKKERWFYRPADYKSHSRGQWSMEKIRDKYGSKTVDTREQNKPGIFAR